MVLELVIGIEKNAAMKRNANSTRCYNGTYISLHSKHRIK